MSNIYGYLIILSMCILERVCLRWLKDRFGCDENAYDIIDQFERKIVEVDDQIHRLEQKMQNAELLAKKEKMKKLRAEKNKKSMAEKAKLLAADRMHKIEEDANENDGLLDEDDEVSFDFSKKLALIDQQKPSMTLDKQQTPIVSREST